MRANSRLSSETIKKYEELMAKLALEEQENAESGNQRDSESPEQGTA